MLENLSPHCHDPGLYARDDGPTREEAARANKADELRTRIRKVAKLIQLQYGVTIDESVDYSEKDGGYCVTLSLWGAGDAETIFKALKILGGA